MGAAGFHGRVRDGIGWDTRAVTTGSAGRRVFGARLSACGFLVYRPFGLHEPRKLFPKRDGDCVLGRWDALAWFQERSCRPQGR